MRIRDAIAVCAATAAFMLIVQPERLFNAPAGAEMNAGETGVPLELKRRQDPSAHSTARSQDSHRGGDRRGSRRGERFDRGDAFNPFEPLPDPEVFNEEVVALCIEVAQEVNSELADRLRALCDTDPEQFESIMRTRARRILGLAMLKARSPELYGLRMQDMQYEEQANELASQMRQAMADGDTARAEDFEQRLRRVLQVKFALGLKAQYDYLKLMEQHLESMRQSIEEEAANFKETIDRQVERYKSPPRSRWHRDRDLDGVEIPSAGDG